MTEKNVQDQVVGTKRKPGILRIAAKRGDLWFKKIHGGAYQDPGLADIMGVFRGVHFSIELKGKQEKADLMMDVIRKGDWLTRPGLGKRERKQCLELAAVRRAGGIGFVTADPQEVIDRLGLDFVLAPLFNQKRKRSTTCKEYPPF